MNPCIDPSAPTPHPPGSPGKLAVLVARAAAQLPLWHPLDAGGHDAGRPRKPPVRHPGRPLSSEQGKALLSRVLAGTLSVSAAAQLARVTQAAVSQAVKKLRRRLAQPAGA
jgi:hypothetical protein